MAGRPRGHRRVKAAGGSGRESPVRLSGPVRSAPTPVLPWGVGASRGLFPVPPPAAAPRTPAPAPRSEGRRGLLAPPHAPVAARRRPPPLALRGRVGGDQGPTRRGRARPGARVDGHRRRDAPRPAAAHVDVPGLARPGPEDAPPRVSRPPASISRPPPARAVPAPRVSIFSRRVRCAHSMTYDQGGGRRVHGTEEPTGRGLHSASRFTSLTPQFHLSEGCPSSLQFPVVRQLFGSDSG